MIACERMAPVAGVALLVQCLRDTEPTVRHSAIGVAAQFTQFPAIGIALEQLRTDPAIVHGESLGEFVAALIDPR